MNCPACGSKTKVIDSRWGNSFGWYRRRKCLDCEHRFSTLEVLAERGSDKNVYPSCLAREPVSFLVTIDRDGQIMVSQKKEK